MKKLLVAAAISLGTAASAHAGNPAKPAAAPPLMYAKAPPPDTYSSWTGFYVGGNAGGAWGNFDPSTTTPSGGALLAVDVPQVNNAGQQSIKPSAFTGGLELGYNWQAGTFVYGLEANAESFHLSGSSSSGKILFASAIGGSCPINCFIVNSSAHTDWLATVRGRFGVAVNNWLLFATGGAAFTTLNGDFVFAPSTIAVETASISRFRSGYTIGAGVENRLSSNWSVKAEYLFVDFGRISTTSNNWLNGVVAFPGQVFTHSLDLKANIELVGLNYHF